MRGINRKTVSIAIIVILIILFITGWTVKFYASFLFLFYSLTGSMVVSVIMLGVFQTLLLIPIRILNIRQASDLANIKKEVEEIENKEQKYNIFRGYLDSGNISTLLYSVSFYIQLVSFISIGRLFLTDFYSVRLAPNAIFWFVPYPTYPLEHTIYSFPYVAPTEYIDFGLAVLAVVWGVIILLKLFSSYTMRQLSEEYGEKKLHAVEINPVIRTFIRLFSDNSLILLIASWIIVRHFPAGWDVMTFTGDLTIPNVSLNTLTATITFFTVLWLNRNPIRAKVETLAKAGLDKAAVEYEKTQLWRSTLINALLIALAAFFMTNQIPSAFELSVFTLEIIALFSPFTLDLIIRRTQKG